MGTWNVAGVGLDAVDDFLGQLSDNYVWDILFLQEGFRRTEGIACELGHLLFTPCQLAGNLRCPAVVVHEKWKASAEVRYAGSGARWVAVSFAGDMLLISLHLPHMAWSLLDFLSPLDELRSFLRLRPEKRLLFGIDANEEMGPVVDHRHVGGATMNHQRRHLQLQRAALLHDFLADFEIYLANTFMNDDSQAFHTRTNWAGGGATQIDFLAASLTIPCSSVGIDCSLDFSTDHRMVHGVFETRLPCRIAAAPYSVRGWLPKTSWSHAAQASSFEWGSWDEACRRFKELALKHMQRNSKHRDEVLASLLEQHSTTDNVIDRRLLNRLIWRRRRYLRRQKAKKALEKIVQDGGGIAKKPKNLSVNWGKLFDGADAALVLRQKQTELYSLSVEELQNETLARAAEMAKWADLKIDMAHYTITRVKLQKAIAKVKRGRGSTDGCTGEMFAALPEEHLDTLALFFTNMFSSLDIPESWTSCVRLLIPKVVGASNLDSFRGIACLSAARKILGYLWMQMLPALTYTSFQTGFVAGMQAADGIFVIKRAAELSREWCKSMFICQLDLSRAFDRVKHSTIIKALKLQGCSMQCLAVLCAMLGQGQTASVLGHVQAAATSMNRGLPQGAPESPLIFTLVTEFILRPLLQKWRATGCCWKLDSFWLACVCYADDILLVASSKTDLEKMVAEVQSAFATAGLDVSPKKCHWTSKPKSIGSNLNIGGELVSWERHLVFVGCKVDLSGNDGDAMEHRLAQGSKVFYKWRSYLQCPYASLRKRMELLVATSFSSALWLGQTWLPTKQQQKHFDSWGARLVSRMACLKRSPSEELGQYWRRMHRFGHTMLREVGGSLGSRRLTALHGYAGHVARSAGTLMESALRTRCLSWWRFQQDLCRGNRYGLHPQRFKAWRWESQLTSFYGEAASENALDNVGWMLRAQDRASWRNAGAAFAGT